MTLVAAMFWLVPAIVAANVYELVALRSIIVALLVDVPAALVIVHAVFAAMAAAATVKMTAASLPPVFVNVVVKVLVPQPVGVGLSVPLTVKPGSVTVNLSPMSRTLFKEKAAEKTLDCPQF